MSDLSDESRSVLERARRELAPSVEHRLRLRQAVLERVASADTGVVASAAQQSGIRLTLKAHAGKLLGVTLVALAAGLAAWSMRSSDPVVVGPRVDAALPALAAPISSPPVETPPPAHETAPTALQAAVTDPSPARVAPGLSVQSKPAKVAAASSSPSAAGGGRSALALEEEYRLIDTAHSAVSAGQFERALTLIDTHAARFPHGQLAQQRERLRVEALVATARLDEARSAAALFRQQYPNGILRPSVERALVEKTPARSP